MKKLFTKSLLLMAAMMLISVSACAHSAPQPGTTQFYNQADTVLVKSNAMNRNITTVVIVPKRYFDSERQDEQYPVLYLLHGAVGSYRDWPRKANLNNIANNYGVIIVCPDGQDSWYFDSPIDPKMQFETFVSKELVAYVDNHYRTFANRYMRAITGLSMGGHGALFLAFRHPDVFWSCGSMSGCTDITKYPDNWHIKDRLGYYHDNPKRWREHAVCNLVRQVKECPLEPAQNILIDDGLNDIFIQDNIALHEQMVNAGIDHDFTVRPGRHSWDYWVNALDYHMIFFHKAFMRGIELMNE